MAGDGPKHRDLVIDAGAVGPISELLDRADPSSTTFVRNASWTLSNLCRSRPAPQFHKIMRAIPTLVKVLKEHDSPEIIADICWAISYLSDGGQAQIPHLLQANALPRII